MKNENSKFLIVGLGNPGEKFKNTRHNIGFRVLDYFAKENNFPEFALSKKFNALISESETNGRKVLLAKPQTFMNSSGKAVKKIVDKNKLQAAYYKLQYISLIVVHDDIDLLFGKIKISQNRGSAGHRGVESIIKELGTKNFTRLRVGIQLEKGKLQNTEVFVLKNFTGAEEKGLEQTICLASLEIKKIINNV